MRHLMHQGVYARGDTPSFNKVHMHRHTPKKSQASTLPETVILENSAEPTVESCKRFSCVHSPRDRLTVHVKPFTDSGQRSSAILTVSSPTFLAMNNETACCK